jgi:hypothetical protein
MILYTAMPLELIFNTYENPRQFNEVRIGHMTMVIEPLSSTQGRIIRLISPDPQDYLNPHYAPGQLINFQPSF